MEQLSFFDSEKPYWKLVGHTYEDKYFLHESCGYTFPFAGFGYRIKKICPRCSATMISFYDSGVD